MNEAWTGRAGKRIRKLVLLVVVCLSSFAGLSAGAVAAQRIGVVAEAEGDVRGQVPEMQSRRLVAGDPVFTNDTLQAGTDARLAVLFEDDSWFELGPGATLVIDRYVFDPEGEKNSFVSSVKSGGFRMVSGLIAKADPNAMLIDMPSVSMGIRGTHVAGEIEGDAVSVVLLESEDGKPAQIELVNRFGQRLISSTGFGATVRTGEAPGVPSLWKNERITGMLERIRVTRMEGLRPSITEIRTRFSAMDPERKKEVLGRLKERQGRRTEMRDRMRDRLRDGGPENLREGGLLPLSGMGERPGPGTPGERLRALPEADRRDLLQRLPDIEPGKLNTLREQLRNLPEERRQELLRQFQQQNQLPPHPQNQ